MNIYKISQYINNDYDTYDAAIVAAENEDQARKIHPSSYKTWSETQHCWVYSDTEDRSYFDCWAPIYDVKVSLLAENVPNLSTGVILASFNAG